MGESNNIKEFVLYIVLAFWGIATCATFAQVINSKADAFVSCSAAVTLVGVIVAIIKFVKQSNRNCDAD